MIKPTGPRYDLRDTSFIVPFFYDSKERCENLVCILDWITENFDTNIILVEEDEVAPTVDHAKHSYGVNYIFMKRTIPGIFHRTKVINAGIKATTTPYISIYDTDCIFPPAQVAVAVEKLREGADACYPYGGDFVDIDRSYIATGVVKERESFTKESVGGAVFLKRERYIEAGMENENLISHAPEDVERFYRMKTLGRRVERVDGKCWHITHSRGPNSGPLHQYVNSNMKEYLKVRAMEKKELEEYIKTWTWAATE